MDLTAYELRLERRIARLNRLVRVCHDRYFAANQMAAKEAHLHRGMGYLRMLQEAVGRRTPAVRMVIEQQRVDRLLASMTPAQLQRWKSVFEGVTH